MHAVCITSEDSRTSIQGQLRVHVPVSCVSTQNYHELLSRTQYNTSKNAVVLS